MKITLLLFTLLFALSSLSTGAHEKSSTTGAKSAGPNGGRILAGTTPPAEFFITPDRLVQITFLDDQGQPVAPAGQIVIVTAGDRAAPTRLTFTPSGQALLSNAALPAGNLVPTVVQITPDPGAKTFTVRFNVNLAICLECRHAEYACICEGH